MGQQVIDGHLAQASERMRVVRHQHQPVLAIGQRGQRDRPDRALEDADVRQPALDRLDHTHAVELLQVHLDVRPRRMAAAKVGGQELHHGRCTGGDPDHAPVAVQERGGVVLHPANGMDQAACMRQHGAARIGQRHAMRAALEQRQAELRLQLANAP